VRGCAWLPDSALAATVQCLLHERGAVLPLGAGRDEAAQSVYSGAGAGLQLSKKEKKALKRAKKCGVVRNPCHAGSWHGVPAAFVHAHMIGSPCLGVCTHCNPMDVCCL
jgi:hypothetical protein